MKRLVLMLSFGFFCFMTQTAFAETLYKNYHNKRFGYSISYPKDILYPQGEADNGDGQKFLSKEAGASLLVYGSHNFNDQTLEERYQEDSRGETEEYSTKVVTYRLLKKNWFVISGYVSGKIFYQKTILNNNQFKTFYFEYPETKKKTYDSIIKHLSTSFKG
jgi:hypothetical protein